MNDSVLVVVDVQNGFVSSKSAPIVPHVASLTERWKGAGLPYLQTRFINPPGSPYERLINWTRMRESPEIDLHEQVAHFSAGAIAVLDKFTYSIFTDEFRKLRDSYGWTNIVLAGIATESCILKSAADAFETGLTPWIVTDAVFSHAGQAPHDAGLLVAGRFVGRNQLIASSDIPLLDLSHASG